MCLTAHTHSPVAGIGPFSAGQLFQPLIPKPTPLLWGSDANAAPSIYICWLSLGQTWPVDLACANCQGAGLLQDRMALETLISIVCKLTEGGLEPLLQITDENPERPWPLYGALGNLSGDQPPTGLNSALSL